MIKLYFLRHGETEANTRHAYLGTTDEPLNDNGILQAMNCEMPDIKRVYTSPMLRCQQTAGIIFPNAERIAVDGFRECNFGDFECKNYNELKDDEYYKEWMASGGTKAFPNGESMLSFQARCVDAFEKIIDDEWNRKPKSLGFVVHGGTIMGLFHKFSHSDRSYLDWKVENCRGFSAVILKSEWEHEKAFHSIEEI